MSAPFGPKATATAEAGDLFMITRGSGAALEVEKVDPAAAETAELIATGIDALLGGDSWRTGGGAGGGAANTVLSGSGAPASGTARTVTSTSATSDWTIYGPKTAGAWGAPASLIGTAGATAAMAQTGPPSSPGPARPRATSARTATGTSTPTPRRSTGPRPLAPGDRAHRWWARPGLPGRQARQGPRSPCARPRPTSSISTSVTPTGPSSSPSARSPVRWLRRTGWIDGRDRCRRRDARRDQQPDRHRLYPGPRRCREARRVLERWGDHRHRAAEGHGRLPDGQRRASRPVRRRAGHDRGRLGRDPQEAPRVHAKTLGQDAVVSLAKIATNAWRLFGLLEAA